MIVGADLDHVAVAVEHWADVRSRYVEQLGGTWLGGMQDPGFAWAQVIYANGMRLEMLEPHAIESNDFLRRFLDGNGPGPHHLTFTVPDLQDALNQAEAAGYRPVGVNLDHPDWKEAFIHPKDGPGVVIQLAQSSGEWEGDQVPAPTAKAAALTRVTHAVANLDNGLRLFEGLLGGAALGDGDEESARWVDVGWPGPGRVRVATPTSPSSPLAAWLGDRPGRVHHLAFSVEGLDRPTEVAPEDNFGVRLLLSPG